MTSVMESAVQINIAELARRVNRRPATIRAWERHGLLPEELLPKRSDRGWRYWTPSQVEGIKTWMVEQDLRPGKGLPHYKPSDAKVEQHLERQRRPRGPRTA